MPALLFANDVMNIVYRVFNSRSISGFQVTVFIAAFQENLPVMVGLANIADSVEFPSIERSNSMSMFVSTGTSFEPLVGLVLVTFGEGMNMVVKDDAKLDNIDSPSMSLAELEIDRI